MPVSLKKGESSSHSNPLLPYRLIYINLNALRSCCLPEFALLLFPPTAKWLGANGMILVLFETPSGFAVVHYDGVKLFRPNALRVPTSLCFLILPFILFITEVLLALDVVWTNCRTSGQNSSTSLLQKKLVPLISISHHIHIFNLCFNPFFNRIDELNEYKHVV